ncbi:hypothetical protein ACA910_020571 [Epithemia clementina (nom. ined.)]
MTVISLCLAIYFTLSSSLVLVVLVWNAALSRHDVNKPLVGSLGNIVLCEATIKALSYSFLLLLVIYAIWGTWREHVGDAEIVTLLEEGKASVHDRNSYGMRSSESPLLDVPLAF